MDWLVKFLLVEMVIGLHVGVFFAIRSMINTQKKHDEWLKKRRSQGL